MNPVVHGLMFEGRCVIVDSTRRGKSMPDALSKTVPIWTCVLNRHLFPNLPESHELRTPPNVISQSEHSQIESRIEGFVQQLKVRNLDHDVSFFHVLKPSSVSQPRLNLHSCEPSKAPSTNMDHTLIKPPTLAALIPGLPPNSPLHSLTTSARRRIL